MKFPKVLKNKNFFLLWLAQGISNLGDTVTNYTLIILVNAITHSTADIATLVIMIALPKIIFGLIAGVYVDRWNRKFTMLTSDSIRAILVLIFIVATVSRNVWLIYTIAFLQAAVGTFFDPARGALVQVVVSEDQYMEANSISQTLVVIGQFAGATLAGLLVGLTGQYAPAFIVDALTFVASVGLVWFVHLKKIHTVNSETPQHFLHALQEGIRTVMHNSLLLAIIITMTILMFAVSPLQVLLVPLITNILHYSTTWLGIVQGGDTLGNIIAGVVIVGIAARIRPKPIFVISVFGLSLAIAGIGIAYNIPSLFFMMFVLGLVSVGFQTSIGTIMQESVSNEVMGRVLSLFDMLPGVASVISLALVGILGATIGVRQTFFFAGAIMALSGIYALSAFRIIKVKKQSS
jgi:DHA3 family macrolide efflux protein-like MFS transporter